MHVTYTLDFVRFSLRWAVFELQPNFWKSAPDDPKWPWHVQVKKYQCACYKDTRAQIFVRSALQRDVFKEIGIFEFPIGYNVKIYLLVTLKEFKILKF